MSIVSRRIDEVVSSELARVLKQHRFRRDGRTFRRWDGPLCLIVNVQASRGNFGENGRFYMNLALYMSELQPSAESPSTGNSGTEKPKEFQGQRRTRLEKGAAVSDGWWEIGPETSVEALSAEVADLLEERGLTWLLAQISEAEQKPSCLDTGPPSDVPLDMTHS
ncbi:DUF4304 domain-containing protein [Deinococcus radiomollis]|uniref:DUF4304 domain-containing protein n=1 Tax=Deinococcus radiomollis TaxID=468916 RepID=UPI003891CEC8